MTDILWSILIVVVYYKIFIKLVRMGRSVKNEIVLDEAEEKISS